MDIGDSQQARPHVRSFSRSGDNLPGQSCRPLTWLVLCDKYIVLQVDKSYEHNLDWKGTDFFPNCLFPDDKNYVNSAERIKTDKGSMLSDTANNKFLWAEGRAGSSQV